MNIPHFDKADIALAEELEKEKNLKKEEVEKEQQVIEYFSLYKKVIMSINNIVPTAIQLLGSKNNSDVTETIELFVCLHKLRINSSFDGVKRMLSLFIRPDETIKKRLIDAYKSLYFEENISLEMQAAYLIDLAISLNFSEFTCFKEMMKLLIENKSINMLIFKEIWRIFVRNPQNEIANKKFYDDNEANTRLLSLANESRVALQIINISADSDKNILLNNAEFFIKYTLNILQRKAIDWLLIKECLIGLQKIYKMKKDNSEICLLKITKTILKGLGTQDKNWFPATQELIDTIFQIFSSPEQFCQFLVFKMSKPIFRGVEINKDLENEFSTQNISSKMNIKNIFDNNILENTQIETDNKMEIDGEWEKDATYSSIYFYLKLN